MKKRVISAAVLAFMFSFQAKAQNDSIATNYKKQKLLIKIADLYAQEKNVQEEIQFDIISLLKMGNQWKINHIEDAFEDSF